MRGILSNKSCEWKGDENNVCRWANNSGLSVYRWANWNDKLNVGDLKKSKLYFKCSCVYDMKMIWFILRNMENIYDGMFGQS